MYLPARIRRPLKRAYYLALAPLYALVLNPLNRSRNAAKRERRLEIGPGPRRIEGFETLNVVGGRDTDYVYDAAKRLPFANGTFSLIYASHVLEHVPWYRVEECLKEWVRILKPGGSIEIWVPDGLKIARCFVEAETNGSAEFQQDGWFRFNENHDPCLWAAGRFFSYGDGTGNKNDPNWHLAIFSPRYLKEAMERAGLVEVGVNERASVRGYDHGWINLGMKGRKP